MRALTKDQGEALRKKTREVYEEEKKLRAEEAELNRRAGELGLRASALRSKRWQMTTRRLIGEEVKVCQDGPYAGMTGVMLAATQRGCEVDLGKFGVQEFGGYPCVTSIEPNSGLMVKGEA